MVEYKIFVRSYISFSKGDVYRLVSIVKSRREMKEIRRGLRRIGRRGIVVERVGEKYIWYEDRVWKW